MTTAYPSKEQTAQEAHQAALQDCQTRLEQIEEHLKRYKKPQGLHWGHVGSLNYIATQLGDILDFLNGEG